MKKIKFLHNKAINREKWDDCIEHALNSKVYAFSWYLDIVSDDWDGIIYGDYELVFPIIIKQHILFKKVVHPLFCQQLGPFSTSKKLLSNSDIFSQILDYLNRNYRKFEFGINHNCKQIFIDTILNKHSYVEYLERVNLELNLSVDYKKIFQNYNNNTKRNLKKFINMNVSIQDILDPLDFIDLLQKNINSKANLKSHHYKIINNLILKCIEKNMGSLYGLYNEKKELLAATFFVQYCERDTLLFNISSRIMQGNSMTFLIDQYIQKTCFQNKILDFEGSNIIGIQRFYKGFGAVEKNYIYIKK